MKRSHSEVYGAAAEEDEICGLNRAANNRPTINRAISDFSWTPEGQHHIFRQLDDECIDCRKRTHRNTVADGILQNNMRALVATYNNTLFRWTVTACYASLIALVSLLPSGKLPRLPIHIQNFDKIAHCLMYGGLAFLLCWAVRYSSRHSFRLMWVFLGSQLYGVSVEGAQWVLFTSDRLFSWADIAANAIGAGIVVTVLGWHAHRFRASNLKHRAR